MIGGNKAVLVSEVGWRGMKEFSSSLLKRGLLVDIVIKGSVDKEILGLVSKPKGLVIRAIPKKFFKPYLFFYLLWHKTAGDLKKVVVSKEATRNWAKRFGFETQILIETNKGYEIRNDKDR